MSNRYWQVLRTYLERPRFWVLSVTYLLIICFWFWYYDWNLPAQRQGQAIISVIYGNLIACFLGLHVRRQFSHAGAQAIPGYAAPHLVVAALLCSILWLVIPLIAILVGRWPPGALVIHALVAILAGVVACWPRAILLVMALPVYIAWDNRPLPTKHTPLLEQLYQGERPNLAVTLIALAVVSQVVAAIMLLRLPRKGITTNDEFTIETPTTAVGVNPVNDWLLDMREAAAQRLTQAYWLPQVQRWRAPVAIVPALLCLPAAIVAAAALIGFLAGGSAAAGAWAGLTLAITCAVVLLVPLAPWQSRRRAMSQEILRPVTRERYYRQYFAAMALDVVVWTSMASLLLLAMFISTWYFFPPANRLWGVLVAMAFFYSLLWSVATFVFGVGVATLRWRFWLPIVAAITLAWTLGAWATIFWTGEYLLRSMKNLDPYMPYLFAGFCTLTATVGLGLTVITYRRWVRGDVV